MSKFKVTITVSTTRTLSRIVEADGIGAADAAEDAGWDAKHIDSLEELLDYGWEYDTDTIVNLENVEVKEVKS